MGNFTSYRSTILSDTWSASWVNSYNLILILSGITLIAFLPTFSNDFQLDWDDTWQVLENPLVNGATLQDIRYHFTHFWQQQYSPVNSVFYLGIAGLFGMDATAFHIACLLVHWGSTVLVFFIIKKLTEVLLPNHNNKKAMIYAFFTALIFAIHPLQVESVAWISASKIVLYGFFALVAFYSYIRYIQTSNWLWLIVTAMAYLLGFGSKEQAIILPLNLILFDYIFGRYADLNWKKLLTSGVILEKIPFFLMALGFWYFSLINNLGTVNPGGYPVYQRLVFGLYSITEYIFRFLAPVKLYFFHPFPISPGEALPLYYFGYILLAGIIGYYNWGYYRKGNRLVVVGFLFFLINLLLVLHIIPLPRTVITADRYMYLSIIGLALIVIWQVDQWLSTPNRPIIIVGCFAWFLFLGVHSFLRTADWKNSETAKASVNEIIEKKKNTQEAEPFNFIENE
ncbi:hypothetical protein LZF95_08765 [Algoriphagus sp. AGSA1]|uniref:hypothetical protein n=1 Tax=Algoriphagus sp. AGSA1 TaxID=2907213 RepID=UPI001F378066|nr:hypothetical protein [Algoriphagus sp. AGSA1]MCE7054762.1 hypothetical protein [Algoriphagus sp. AGSA1]